MDVYKTKSGVIPGTIYHTVRKIAMQVFDTLKKRTKRKPYIRSTYFYKDKIFFDYYWQHLWQSGGYKERVRRLRYFEAAIEVLRYSRIHPITIENPHKKSELLHRFAGKTREGF